MNWYKKYAMTMDMDNFGNVIFPLIMLMFVTFMLGIPASIMGFDILAYPLFAISAISLAIFALVCLEMSARHLYNAVTNIFDQIKRIEW